MKRNKGFTLIELMIVVAIIAIIAAIAIPNLLRSRMQSNESSAIGNLRTVLGSQVAYHATYNAYSADFATLQTSAPPYIDGDWSLTKSGYNYVMGGTTANFSCNANAQDYATTGGRGFYVDASGIIKAEIGADATVASTPIGE